MVKPLVAASSFALSQFIDECISPAALELCEICIHQHRALSPFLVRIGSVPTGFGCDSWQGPQFGVGIAPEVFFPGPSILAVKPIPMAVQRGIGRLPSLIVKVSPPTSLDGILRDGIIRQLGDS